MGKKEKKKKSPKIKEKSAKKKTGNIYKVLTEQIVGMGYSWSMMDSFKKVGIYVILVSVIAYFHHLQPLYIGILLLLVMGFLPFSIYAQYKYLYEQKRFQELCIYMKNMKVNFQQYNKIIIALKETLENFSPESTIYPYMVQAIDMIENGVDFKDALYVIEKPYKNSFITRLHAYMILGETEGGDYVMDAINSIDFNSWRSDTFNFQTQKYKYQNQNGFYTLFGLSISFGVILMFDNMFANETIKSVLPDLFSSGTFQIATLIYFALDLTSFIFIKTMISKKWINEDE